MSNNPFLMIDRQIIGDVYTATEAMDNLTVLCDDFGSRFGGTAGERRAAEFIRDKLEAYGLSNVHLEPISYMGWRRGTAELEIMDPIQKRIDCISLPHSPPAAIEATLIDLGDGAPRNFERHAADIQGKIVLANSEISPQGTRRWIHRGEKYGRSLMAGASAFIFVNHYPAYGPATGGIGQGREALIPGISVSHEDGAFLQRLLRRHGKVHIRIKTTDRSEPMESWNVIGDLPGREDPNTTVMLGCHYDGHDISQGAQDPASGAVAVMEAARVLALYAPDLPYTVRFALWGVEEIGLLGSREYARRHGDELHRLRFYLNMDGAGAVKEKGIVLNEWEALEPLFSGWSEQMALEFETGQSVHAFSDHFPFLMEGVPTGGIETVRREMGGRGYGHTRYDTLDKVKMSGLREAAVLASRLALRLASERNWPAKHRTREEVSALFDTPDYREEAEFRAQLDAFYEKARG